MKFPRMVFLAAGLYGLLVLLPLYFLEEKTGRDFPPPVTHPEYYYGFVGVALAWQVLFLILSRDPVRYRPVMIPAVLEKAAYGLAVAVLYSQARVSTTVLATGLIDLALGTLFAVAYLKTPARGGTHG